MRVHSSLNVRILPSCLGNTNTISQKNKNNYYRELYIWEIWNKYKVQSPNSKIIVIIIILWYLKDFIGPKIKIYLEAISEAFLNSSGQL